MTLGERWQAFSARERNGILVAAAMLAVTAAYYGYSAGVDMLPGASAPTSGEENWVKLQKIENYRRIVSRDEAALAAADSVRKRYREQQGRLMSGATPTQVGAELQGYLSTLAGDAGLNVLSSQILREEEKDGYRRIGVRLTLSGALEGVTKLLAGVEGGQNDLLVTNLEINRKLGASRRTSASRAPATAAAPLTVSFEVKTFLREDA